MSALPVDTVVDQNQPLPVTEADARDLVALHAAATLLPEGATLAEREQVRQRWAAALQVVPREGSEWVLLCLPGLFFHDAEPYAVHVPSGRVLGGACPQTALRRRESTTEWLARLAG